MEEELRGLSQKKSDLEDELTVSTIKQEAMMMHERLAEAEAKRDAILDEVNAEGTPEQQREKVLVFICFTSTKRNITAMGKINSDVNRLSSLCREEKDTSG